MHALSVLPKGIVFTVYLVRDHFKQVIGNVTTNEVINRFKYEHFHRQSRHGDDIGAYMHVVRMCSCV